MRNMRNRGGNLGARPDRGCRLEIFQVDLEGLKVIRVANVSGIIQRTVWPSKAEIMFVAGTLVEYTE